MFYFIEWILSYLHMQIILQTEAEIKQGRSPSRLDTFIKTLEEDKDYYKCETENLLKVFRNAFSSPKQTSTCDSMSKKFSSIQVSLRKHFGRGGMHFFRMLVYLTLNYQSHNYQEEKLIDYKWKDA